MATQPFGGQNTAIKDPFYSFNRYRQKPDFDWTTTPAIGGPSGYLEENPDVAYTRYMTNTFGTGLGDESAWANHVRDQYRNTQAGFMAGLAEDPTLTYQKYLTGLGAKDIRRAFLRKSGRHAGENNTLLGGPMRTIADV